ncbi:helix-turn-helix domain-containing protein [Intrasporangium sp. DVR]|uniref:GlxA family transcriptional regulator n=1 Tax=Intrasporangium sp. DVR TaxID=3127867 RepID=UPI00313A502C
MLRSVAVILEEPVAPFELAVLCEVFGIDRTEDGVPSFDFRVCAADPTRVLATKTGMGVVATHSLDAARDADLVAVPGGSVNGPSRPEVLEILREAVDRGARVLSVCSGAFWLAEAGLLDGRDCATHWKYANLLATRFPRARVDLDALYVDDGPVLTSAGTAAGIDACLYLVGQELGTDVANRIARRMVVSPHRAGGQRQFVESPMPAEPSDGLQGLLDWLLEHLDEEHSIPSLAARVTMSERTFARRFSQEVGTTPHKWLTAQRVLRARRLLETTTLDVEGIARACGFATAALLRTHFQREVGLAPLQYRRTFAGHGARSPSGQPPWKASSEQSIVLSTDVLAAH